LQWLKGVWDGHTGNVTRVADNGGAGGLELVERGRHGEYMQRGYAGWHVNSVRMKKTEETGRWRLFKRLGGRGRGEEREGEQWKEGETGVG
jgi:hypothetical protein